MKLSVLIPSLNSRSELLSRLLHILSPQVTSEVEVVIEIDSGVKTIGAKRNSLLRKANGEYVAYVDDDDRVTGDYVSEMLNGIAMGVDAVCVQSIYSEDGVQKGLTFDVPYQAWSTKTVDGVTHFLRGAQHLDAIRREIAMAVEFDQINFSEDHHWSRRIAELGLIKSWHCVDHPTYLYDYVTQKAAATGGEQNTCVIA